MFQIVDSFFGMIPFWDTISNLWTSTRQNVSKCGIKTFEFMGSKLKTVQLQRSCKLKVLFVFLSIFHSLCLSLPLYVFLAWRISPSLEIEESFGQDLAPFNGEATPPEKWEVQPQVIDRMPNFCEKNYS